MKTRFFLIALFACLSLPSLAQTYEEYMLYGRKGETYAQYKARVKRQKRTNIAISILDAYANAKDKKNTTTKKTTAKTTAKKSTKPNATRKIYPVVTPGYVDLGLPSGIHWATMNLGAKVPEEVGNYYAWGEVKPKTQFTVYNSTTADIKNDDFVAGIKNIYDTSGTRYDAAFMALGENWKTPNGDQVTEMLQNCTKRNEVINGVSCTVFIGPSGDSIVVPHNKRIYEDQEMDYNEHYYLLFSNRPDNGVCAGQPIRPINTDRALIEASKKKTKEREEALARQKIIDEINNNVVDLGIGVLWAKCNYRANNPWEAGLFIESKTNCDISFYSQELPLSHYYTRLPTLAELNDLAEKCTWVLTSENGVQGYQVTGPNGNSMFIPCAGLRDIGGDEKHKGVSCYLWSSSKVMMGPKALCVKKGKAKSVIGITNAFNIRPVYVAPAK